MPVDLHFICKQGENHFHLRNQIHETGNWVVSDEVADQAVGGRLYLHERQAASAWHGGTILRWHRSLNESRKIFTYKVDGEFRIACPGGWAQEKAIVRR